MDLPLVYAVGGCEVGEEGGCPFEVRVRWEGGIRRVGEVCVGEPWVLFDHISTYCVVSLSRGLVKWECARQVEEPDRQLRRLYLLSHR